MSDLLRLTLVYGDVEPGPARVTMDLDPDAPDDALGMFFVHQLRMLLVFIGREREDA